MKARANKFQHTTSKDCLAGMDFFTVPSATFNLLYVFFVIHHARRTILHFAVTIEPYALWIVQQLREVFPESHTPQYVILGRDGKYGDIVPAALKAMGAKLVRTAYRAPWQIHSRKGSWDPCAGSSWTTLSS